MPLSISDNVLSVLRAKSPQTLIELACRLYTADEISKPEATRLAGLERIDFEAELTKRGLPWIRINYDETYQHEFAELRQKLSARAGQSS